jgi:hypothetical protein
MTPREIFGIVVRSFGLFAIIWGLWGASGALFPEDGSQAFDYVIGYAPLAVIGLMILVGADSVVSLGYGTRYMEPYDEPTAPEESAENA